MNDLRDQFMKKTADISSLPANAKYLFGAESSSEEYPVENLTIQKTRRRTIVSLNYSKFQSKEIIMEKNEHGKSITFRSSKLASIVPSSSKYSYDLRYAVLIKSTY